MAFRITADENGPLVDRQPPALELAIEEDQRYMG
jgi:hypothetical protein